MRTHYRHWIIALSIALPLAAAAPAAGALAIGDILVADSSSILRIDPATGAVSTFFDGGTTYSSISSLTLGPDGNLYATFRTGQLAGVFSLAPATGVAATVSSGDQLRNPTGLAFEPGGGLVVADWRSSDNQGKLFRINTSTGAQTVLSSGGFFDSPGALVVESGGSIVVADPFSNNGSLIRVNPATGAQTLLSSGGLFNRPVAVALDAAGQLLVADIDAGGAGDLDPLGAVIRVDPLTGAQTMVSAGGMLVEPYSIAVDLDGSILVGDWRTWLGEDSAILRIDPLTGSQWVLLEGDPLNVPFGLVVIPEPSMLTLPLIAAGLCLVRRRGRFKRPAVPRAGSAPRCR